MKGSEAAREDVPAKKTGKKKEETKEEEDDDEEGVCGGAGEGGGTKATVQGDATRNVVDDTPTSNTTEAESGKKGDTTHDEKKPTPHFGAASLLPHAEHLALVWESDWLRQFYSFFYDLLQSTLIGVGAKRALAMALGQALVATAELPLTALSAASLIDNPWSICLGRADKAGVLLARRLANRQRAVWGRSGGVHSASSEGRNASGSSSGGSGGSSGVSGGSGTPRYSSGVSLIGVSMGARVVWACLRELANLRLTWLLHDVVLIGMHLSVEELCCDLRVPFLVVALCDCLP
jgi:hypothetical protein